MSTCSVCFKEAEQAYSIDHRVCGHRTHADCMPAGQAKNFKLCAQCDTQRVAGVDAAAAAAAAVVTEPHTKDGIEYWKYPGVRKELPSSSISRSLLSALVSPFQRNASAAAAPAASNTGKAAPEMPLELLRKQIPIPTIIARHGYGLDHMLRDGIVIDDFLANGYSWPDLCQFEYISKMGQFRCLETLTRGLFLDANHLRDNPDRLPFAQIKAQTGMKTSALCSRLGLQFAVNGPLHCKGDTEWNAEHCVQFGLTMEDLMDFGLNRPEHYVDLMKGLTRSEAARAEKALGVTLNHLAEIGVLPAEEAEEIEEKSVRSVYAVEAAAAAADEEEEEEDEEEEEEPTPPPSHTNSKPVAAIAATARPAQRQNVAATATTATAQTRAQERFRMHGYTPPRK